MTFTREEYLQDYKNIYNSLKENGSGDMEFKKGEKYLTLPYKAGYTDDMSLLDYGCGCGAICPGIKTNDYLGVDIVPEAIDLARGHFPNKKFEVLEIGELNIEPKDFCIALSVFTHTLYQDVNDCLGDIARNTKKGLLIDILEGDLPESLHIRYWNKEKFIIKLKEFGFNVTGEFSITAQLGYVHTYLICAK